MAETNEVNEYGPVEQIPPADGEWEEVAPGVRSLRTTPPLAEGQQAPAEIRELLCMICGKEHPVWYAPNDLWNRVIRRDGSDEHPFLCPTCFTVLAEERGAGEMFVVSLAPIRHTETPHSLTERFMHAIQHCDEETDEDGYCECARVIHDTLELVMYPAAASARDVSDE